MTDNDEGVEIVTAALLVIGEEILSGRTRDANTGYIAKALDEVGIALREVRVVPDVEDEIADAVNALRRRYRYVLTTGGIGPTHDDVTTDAIGLAFGVPVAEDPRALRVFEERYPDQPVSPGRRRMSRIPQGAELIVNSVSGAPGFMLDNVIVMAGIPRIMQAMMEDVLPRLEKGRPLASRSIRVDAPEGKVAGGLSDLQDRYPGVRMGSYPFFSDTRVGTFVVLRSADVALMDEAVSELRALLVREGMPHEEAEKEEV
ncbi:competence/damage-inducible protein A [Methyloligella halotolerans]|nr:molybdopterin-binding protein [Methyloligella halotolerans]